MMELSEIRGKLDALDTELTRLFVERMQLVSEVAASKRASGKAVRDSAREQAILDRLSTQAGEPYARYVRDLYRHIFDLSREYQHELLGAPADEADMEYGLIGERLIHSYSAEIHALLGNDSYALRELATDDVDGFLTRRAFKGINVTIPYKKAVLPYCAALSEDAKAIGSVNTLLRRDDGTLYGHNTDLGGFIRMLESGGLDPKGKKAAVLGSGGASLTAQAALRRMGARDVLVISRKGPITYDTLYREHADVEFLVNATPVGMYPDNGISPVDLAQLPNVQAVADMIYNPERTALVLDARERGIPCVSGLSMLVAQAREAAELFSGKPIPKEREAEICAAMRKKTLNLILVGMPGCGKSTLGALAAEAMGRPFFDTDAAIERRSGRSIPELFREKGEEAFRDLESEVLEELCRRSGTVIATGGGAILRKRNRRAMAQNGRVIYVKRELSLLAADGRPLSASRERIAQLWEEREALYQDVADASIENNGALETAARAIWEAFDEAADR